MKNYFELFIDGASKGNPGEAGAGIYILKDKKEFLKEDFYLGIKTNNQAEYLAFLLGLFLLKKEISSEKLFIYSDSLLLVNQINKIYKIKNPIIKKLENLSKEFLNKIIFEINHIKREKNQKADELANLALKNKKTIPEDFKNLLKNNEIF